MWDFNHRKLPGGRKAKTIPKIDSDLTVFNINFLTMITSFKNLHKSFSPLEKVFKNECVGGEFQKYQDWFIDFVV